MHSNLVTFNLAVFQEQPIADIILFRKAVKFPAFLKRIISAMGVLLTVKAELLYDNLKIMQIQLTNLLSSYTIKTHTTHKLINYREGVVCVYRGLSTY